MKSILALIAASCALYGLLIWPIDSPDIVKFLVISQSLALLYFLILYLSKRNNHLFENNKNFFYIIIVSAVLIRLVVSFGAGERFDLSDDVFRYVWEGKIVSHNVNPYITSPDHLEGTPLADSLIYPKINHPWLPTIYPPLSQYFFVTAYLISGDSIIGFKIISLLAELITLLLILAFIGQTNLPRWTLMIYAFSPLVIIEFLFSNHLDILAMPFLIGLLMVIHERKVIWVGVLLAMVTGVKLIGLFFLPALFIYFRGRDKLRLLGSFTVVITLLYLPFVISGGLDVFGSLFEYLSTWQYNGSLFSILKLISTAAIARIISASIFLLISGWLLFKYRNDESPFRLMFLALAVYIICTPSLFTWYLIWIIPFLIIYRSSAFLALTGTIFLSYHVLIGYYDQGQWSEIWQLHLLEYLPFYLILIYEMKKTVFYRRIAT